MLCLQTCGINTLCLYSGSTYKINFNCTCMNGYTSSQNDGRNCINPINNCAINNGGCSQICRNLGPKIFQCECNPGYTIFVANKSDCTPINDCIVNNGGCSQLCTYKSPGLSFCSCFPGQYSNETLNESCQSSKVSVI